MTNTRQLPFAICLLSFAIQLNVFAAEAPLPNPDTDPLMAAIAATDPHPPTVPITNPAALPTDQMAQPVVNPQVTAPRSMSNPPTNSLAEPVQTPRPSSVRRTIGPAVPARIAPPAAPLSTDTVMEQGKALYENGQLVSALDKFMKVLRRDPQHAEARRYLRMVMDELRTWRRATPRQLREVVESVSSPVLDEEVRARVRQRQLLTLDLDAIPGVHTSVDSKQGQVEIDTSLLFAEKTGGLKEDGIPVLDRVAAWLKTFGQQPVAIHCYPEELAEASLNGSLFLHRYAQLYGFFVDEKKLTAARFINANFMKLQTASTGDAQGAPVAVSTAPPRVVITTFGGGSLLADEMQTAKVSGWLEFSLLSSQMKFNPEEGDWASLELCALAPKGVRVWYFKIIPQKGDKASPIYNLEGKGNLLKRLTWDGRSQKTGSFVSTGDYLCRLVATDVNGSTLAQELTLKVQRSGADIALAEKPRPAKHLSKRKPKPKVDVAASSPAAVGGGSMDLPAGRQVPPPKTAGNDDKEAPAPSSPADVAADTSNNEGDAHAIWKQVIQFDANETDLKPSLKASLERIGKTLEVYPLQKVRITGFAETSETNASKLANQRADRIRETLINEYQVDAHRVIVAGGHVKSGSSGHDSKVEISITN